MKEMTSKNIHSFSLSNAAQAYLYWLREERHVSVSRFITSLVERAMEEDTDYQNKNK